MAATLLEALTSKLHLRPAATYSPDTLPLLQSLLRTLADIDFGFQKDLETVERSKMDQALKQHTLARIKQRHHERRTPYVRELNKLQKKTKATYG
jgi:hypothetical protein